MLVLIRVWAVFAALLAVVVALTASPAVVWVLAGAAAVNFFCALRPQVVVRALRVIRRRGDL